MAAKPWEHADRVRATLQAIVADPGLGVAALSSGRLAANALEDFLPDAPRERAVLLMAAQAGIAQALLGYAAQGVDAATAVRLAAALLENTSPLDADTCRWIVTETAGALGMTVPADARARGGIDDDLAEPDPETTGHAPASADTDLAALTISAPATGSPASPAAAARAGQSRPEQQPQGRKRRGPKVNDATFSPDGRLLATAGDDGVARLWEVATGAAAGRLTGHARHVRTVAFSPDGRLVATAAAGDAARLWDAGTGALVRVVTPGPASDVAFSPDGRLLATTGGGTSQPAGVAAAPSAGSAARLWEVATGTLAGSLGSGHGPAVAVAFSPDGQLLATTGTRDAVRLWEVTTRTQIRRLAAPAGAVAFSPDGQLLATAGPDDPVRLWEVATGRLVRAITPAPARDVAFSPDGQVLATAGGGSVTAPGITAASIADHATWLWEVATGTLRSSLAGHDAHVLTVEFSRDSRMLATAARDRTARIWHFAPTKITSRQISGR